MTWAEILIPAATGIAGAVAGAFFGGWLRGKPPAGKDSWDAIDRKVDTENKGR